MPTPVPPPPPRREIPVDRSCDFGASTIGGLAYCAARCRWPTAAPNMLELVLRLQEESPRVSQRSAAPTPALLQLAGSAQAHVLGPQVASLPPFSALLYPTRRIEQKTSLSYTASNHDSTRLSRSGVCIGPVLRYPSGLGTVQGAVIKSPVEELKIFLGKRCALSAS